jgi:hypothetical protein
VQNVDDARYCRACGADISLVPQALTGRLPERYVEPATDDELEGRAGRRRRRRKEKEKEPPTVEKGVENVIAGLGFTVVALSILLFAASGRLWFFWMFIPAFHYFGEGIPMILRARRQQQQGLPPYTPPLDVMRPAPRLNELQPRDTSEMMTPPASVTEGTTRHLDASDKKR